MTLKPPSCRGSKLRQAAAQCTARRAKQRCHAEVCYQQPWLDLAGCFTNAKVSCSDPFPIPMRLFYPLRYSFTWYPLILKSLRAFFSDYILHVLDVLFMGHVQNVIKMGHLIISFCIAKSDLYMTNLCTWRFCFVIWYMKYFRETDILHFCTAFCTMRKN